MRAILVSLALATALLVTISAEAATVKAVKGRKVLVDMGSDKLKAGDVLRINNASGKKGMVKISKIKGTLAEAQLKGVAEVGSTLTAASKRKRSKSGSSVSQAAPPAKKSQSRWGAMAGASMISSEITIDPVNGDPVNVKLDGIGFSAKGLFDYQLFGSFWFRGLLGLEQFNVKGSDPAVTDECSGECKANINYLAGDLWGRFVMGTFWAGAGMSLLFPMTKDVTAFRESSVSTTSIFSVGGGLDMDSFLVQMEYNLYPSTEQVTASAINIRAGLSF